MIEERSRNEALASIDRILDRGGDADDVLRAVVAALGRVYAYVALDFVESGVMVAGPSIGDAGEHSIERVAVSYGGADVGELAVAAEPGDREFLEHVSARISAHVLIGWDTGGQQWIP